MHSVGRADFSDRNKSEVSRQPALYRGGGSQWAAFAFKDVSGRKDFTDDWKISGGFGHAALLAGNLHAMSRTVATQSSLDKIADSMAKAEDRGWSSDYYLLHYRMKALVPRIKGPHVLELGCAEGGMTRELVKYFPSIVAVDGSPALIDKARREVAAPNLTLVCSLLEDFQPEGK